jgi:hypothetical protein
MMLKMAVLAPMPAARVRTVTAAKPNVRMRFTLATLKSSVVVPETWLDDGTRAWLGECASFPLPQNCGKYRHCFPRLWVAPNALIACPRPYDPGNATALNGVSRERCCQVEIPGAMPTCGE